VLKDSVLLFEVAQPKATNCKVCELRSDHHYKLRCYSMFTVHLRKTKSELNLFVSLALYAVVKVYGRKGTPFPHLQFMTQSVCSPTSYYYNARETHTTIVRGPNLNVAFPHL